jgi:Protein of unknown function (DUF3592)
MVESIAKRASKKDGKVGTIFLVLFFGVFLLMGSFFAWMFFLRPVSRVLGAMHWQETTCVILSSEVVGSGDAYRAEMTFRYEVNGIDYTGDAYSFSTVSSSGRVGKQKIVDTHAPGAETTCYVNPADPEQAVVYRGTTRDMWFGTFTLVFPLIGAGGLAILAWSAVHQHRKNQHQLTKGSARLGEHGFSPSPRSPRGPSADVPDYLLEFDADQRPLVLRPRGSRWGELVLFLIFALFWNGIVSIFVFTLVESFLNGDPEWFLAFFLIPFVAIGLGLLGKVVYQLLKIFNPAPILTLDEPATPLGESLHLQWRVRGAVRRIQTLTITLIGQESARYKVGTSTRTSRATFFEAVLVETRDTSEMRSGSLTVAIPEDAMHSLSLESNSIDWQFRITGEIPRWPDIKDEHAIVVLPKGALA